MPIHRVHAVTASSVSGLYPRHRGERKRAIRVALLGNVKSVLCQDWILGTARAEASDPRSTPVWKRAIHTTLQHQTSAGKESNTVPGRTRSTLLSNNDTECNKYHATARGVMAPAEASDLRGTTPRRYSVEASDPHLCSMETVP
jgi:hypothetical protein